MFARIICCLLAIACCGCTNPPSLSVVPPRGINEVPGANLPASMRPTNWTDSFGSGSCVNASTVYMLRWRGREAMADWWRANHAGGETGSSIRAAHDAAGLRYVYTDRADPSFLDWCSQTRRGCIIWFYDSHCVTFCGWSNKDGRQVAMINDNNRPSRYIEIERNEFIRRWAGYGGFGLSLLDPPVPAPLYNALTENRK